MSKNEYTELQRKIISGEVSIDSVRGNFVVRLRNKALKINDIAVVEMAEKQIAINAERYKQRNRARALASSIMRRENRFDWKSPRSDEYTERQKQIVRGEIPLASVSTTDLVRICVKAREFGDKVLEELMLDLIKDRRIASHERDLERKRRMRQDESFGYSKKDKLTQWEKTYLTGY